MNGSRQAAVLQKIPEKYLFIFSVLLELFKKYDGQELQIKNNNVFNLNLTYSHKI